MTEKECFKCKEVKPLALFYVHKQMKDGHLNKCIECTKADSIAARNNKIEHYRAYDRKRGNRLKEGYAKQYRERFPAKHKARSMVGNAIRAGSLYREPCETCGSDKNVHGHHDNYAKPLNVRWLCAAHHHQWHAENGEGLNGV